MVKAKKFISLLVTIFLILSNVAFAQYSSEKGPDYYEGRPIDESKEGKEYYREGAVIVYPAQMGSEEKRMMERFASGDLSEEEMKRMAKAKAGKGFDEMEFKKGIMELKERMERRDAFSYEHKGYGQRYYTRPSYEGYSKEHMVFGMVFQHIGDDIDPREIKQYCNEPEKIADIVINKLKEKIGDLQNLCIQAEENEAKCNEHSKKGCSQLGTAMIREDATEMERTNSIAYSCPLNKDAIIKACILRSKSNIGQNKKHAVKSCEKMFEHEGERLLKECSRFKENQVCDRGDYIERCMGGIKKEDFEKKCPEYPAPDCRDGILKTKTDSNGCSYYYCEYTQPACPTASIPQCAEGSTLQKKTDDKGCLYYSCEAATTACTQDVRQCPDGSYVSRDSSKNCEFKPCPATTAACPEAVAPTCASGQTLQKKTDDKGCVYYYCEKAPCPQVSRPACNADETLKTYYDNAGCVTSYQCIKTQTCPAEPQKPACAEGQSLTTKHDEKNCVVGYECVTVTTTSSITGYAVLSTYEDFLNQCENSWKQQEKSCATMQESCDKDALIERCKQQSTKSQEDHLARIEQNCRIYSDTEIRSIEDKCSRLDKERQRCFEESAKRCEHSKGLAQKCRETLTEENLRKFMIEEAKKRCKFTDIVADEDDVRKSDKVELVLAVLNTATESDIDKLELFVDDLEEELKLQDTTVYKGTINPNNFGDIKLLPFVVNAKISAAASSERAKEVKAKIVAGQKAEETAGKLASLRDSDVPAEYLYIIEDKASDVLDVSEDLDDIEKKEGGKGVAYKVRRFFGLAKKAEQEEIKQLGESKNKLSDSIDALAKLADEVPSDVAKAILKEQVESLKKQQTDIEALIAAKEKKAKGLFGIFG